MTELLRLAGRGRLEGGRGLTWSLAEGSRGRRWRASVDERGGLVLAILVELGLDGRMTRFEATSAAGMLTAHPAADGRTLHGNIVSGRGVSPIELPWGPEHELDMPAIPLLAAVIVHRRRLVPVGGSVDVPVVAIDLGFELQPMRLALTRRSDVGWLLDVDGVARSIEIDARGIPILADSEEWPLEE
ncbi:MAG: hypothetical protein ACJ761_00865 [Chloroflexota bacterium]